MSAKPEILMGKKNEELSRVDQPYSSNIFIFGTYGHTLLDYDGQWIFKLCMSDEPLEDLIKAHIYNYDNSEDCIEGGSEFRRIRNTKMDVLVAIHELVEQAIAAERGLNE